MIKRQVPVQCAPARLALRARRRRAANGLRCLLPDSSPSVSVCRQPLPPPGARPTSPRARRPARSTPALSALQTRTAAGSQAVPRMTRVIAQRTLFNTPWQLWFQQCRAALHAKAADALSATMKRDAIGMSTLSHLLEETFLERVTVLLRTRLAPTKGLCPIQTKNVMEQAERALSLRASWLL